MEFHHYLNNVIDNNHLLKLRHLVALSGTTRMNSIMSKIIPQNPPNNIT